MPCLNDGYSFHPFPTLPLFSIITQATIIFLNKYLYFQIYILFSIKYFDTKGQINQLHTYTFYIFAVNKAYRLGYLSSEQHATRSTFTQKEVLTLFVAIDTSLLIFHFTTTMSSLQAYSNVPFLWYKWSVFESFFSHCFCFGNSFLGQFILQRNESEELSISLR